MKNKKMIAIFLSVIMICSLIIAGPDIDVSAASDITINATDITLYSLDDWAKEYISIPSNMNSSYQLTVKGTKEVSYRVVEGDSVKVSDSGKVTPNVTTWYWYGNMGTTSKNPDSEPDRTTNDVEYGKSVIRVTAGNKTFNVKVEVKNYAVVYADQMMDKYISENINSSMSTYDKIDKIAKFVADKNYSVSYSSATGMIVSGGGDCWASTDTIIQMAQKVGLRAWSRNGNRDLGAGSGHMNAMVSDGKKNYEVEAGYYEEAPRGYSIKERTSLYSTRSDDYGGLEVYQYDGYTMPSVLNIPSEINGKKVTSIGESFAYNKQTLKNVVLPATIKYIGNSAFSSCKKLETINIPASVENMGNFVFAGCTSLKKIDASGIYTFDSGALYKNKKVLVCAPAASKVTIPSGVTEIGYYAFYYNDNIKLITIPSTVTKISEGAFGNCTALCDITFRGNQLKEIGDFAFAYTGLKYLSVPASVTTIGDNMMGYADGIKLVVTKGSAAEAYVKKNNIKYYYPDNIPAESVKLNKTAITLYTGQTDNLTAGITPSCSTGKITWSSSDTKIVTVSNGRIKARKAGMATITAKTAGGKKATCKITVKQGADSIKLNVNKVILGVKESYTLKNTISPSKVKVACTWSTENKNIAVVSKNGKVTAKNTGTTTVTVKTANGKKASCKIVVRKAPKSVKLNKTKLSLKVGKNYTLTPKLPKNTAANSANVKWKSSNPKVVAVKKISKGKGKITAKKKGTAIITYKTYNGKTAKCKVSVK